MKRSVVGGLLVSFAVLFVLVISSPFIPYGKAAPVIYVLFLLELFFFAWLYTKRVTGKQLFRHIVGLALFSFFLLLTAVIVSLFAPKAIPSFVYHILTVDIIILIGLYIRKKLKREATAIDKIGYAISILIPLIIIGYVVYMNWLPFGFEKTYVLDVGSKGDTTTTKELYLEKSDALSDYVWDGEKTFRKLNGTTSLVFEPNAVLENAKINIEIIGDDVFIIEPIEFDSSEYDWDLSIDFSKGIPFFLKGEAELMTGCAYFDGQSALNYLNTSNQFEEGPFAVYVEWTPENDKEDFQQIIGHFNWELLQEKKGVRFLIGRMNNEKGRFHSLMYPIEPDFFNKKHSALGIYNPSEQGYMELSIDGNPVIQRNIWNDTIWQDYNSMIPLSLGKSMHGRAAYYVGCIHKAMFSYVGIKLFVKTLSFSTEYTSGEALKIPIAGKGKIYSIKIKTND